MRGLIIRGLFCTTALLSNTSGGGNASLHEFTAFDNFCDEVEPVDRRTLGIHQDPFKIDKTTSELIERHYDIVHFNGNPFGRTLSVLKYYNPNIKSVVSVPAHDLETSIEEHESYGIDYKLSYPHMVKPDLWNLYTRHIQDSDLVIYPSKLSRDYLTRKLDLNNDNTIIPHGCFPVHAVSMPEIFSPAYLGAVGPDKGIKYLIEAWSQLNLMEQLVFYGRESTMVNQMLPKHSGKSCFYAYGAFDSLGTIMPDTSLGIFPTVTEGFNIPALEFMSFGRPIIVTEGAGVSELITNGEDGFVIPIRDVEALKDKIMFFRNNRDELERMGRNAYETSKKYDWQIIEQMYVDAYTELMS